jgi:NitT/TauT family transport system permease protein
VGRTGTSAAISLISVAAFIALWQIASQGADPSLFPGPVQVVSAIGDLARDGTLSNDIGITLQRVAVGWVLGCGIGVPLGILAGTSRIGRAVVDPFVHFFRFVPALALVSLFLLWFGVGEASKVNLVAYAAAFIATVNTAVGAAGVASDKVDAARCVGASRLDSLRAVIIPATIPHIFTGLRLALANAFLVIVAAEALATQDGIGYLIWDARTYFRTDYIFVGILCFGLLGFAVDRLWKLFGRCVLRRYLRTLGDY